MSVLLLASPRSVLFTVSGEQTRASPQVCAVPVIRIPLHHHPLKHTVGVKTQCLKQYMTINLIKKYKL